MQLKPWKLRFLATVLIACMGIGNLFAQGDDTRALIDTMVKKGLLTNQEAADVAAQIHKDVEMNSGYKIQLGSWIKTLRIWGDARLRYEYREGSVPQFTSPTAINSSPTAANVAPNTYEDLERWRWRLRLNTEAVFTDDFKGGLSIEPGSNPRSANVTFGGNPSTAGGVGGTTVGPFGKGTNGINVSRLYLEWSPAEWVVLTGGRMANPLFTSTATGGGLVWDPDLNPEGARETFKYDVTDKLELFSTLAQFMYDDKAVDHPPTSATAITGGNDAWLFAEQFGAKYTFNKDTTLKIAPVLYVYSGPGDSYTGRFDGTGSGGTSDVAINDLMVVEIPLEFKWHTWGQKFKLFSDVAVNTEGSARADAAGRPDKENQNLAYQAGIQWGEAQHKGDWEASAMWQHTELYSVDPNLVDSDVFDYRLNLEGLVFDVRHYLTENVWIEVRYARADRCDNTLPTTATSDFNIATIDPISKYQLLQCDLNWKF